MSNLSQVNPVRMGPTVDRIGVVDSLRGAALCGVIVFNIVAMVGGFLGKQLLAKAGPLDVYSAPRGCDAFGLAQPSGCGGR